jgi:radical SAM superfamily enzyme YgiQ (UPF0313 family)
MKILIMTLNAKYIHSNLAIHSLYRYYQHYTQNSNHHVVLEEFTINQQMDQVLIKMFEGKYDAIFCSCYIWNIEVMMPLLKNYTKVSPCTQIYLGGPEVSYRAAEYLSRYPFLDGILIGEGERTFYEMLTMGDKHSIAKNVKGLAYREKPSNLVVTSEREFIDPMDEMPFPYLSFELFENRLVYYESIRGCPYACSYCLSADCRQVRFLSKERVASDLLTFLKAKVPQVKFIDRTFNVNKEHACFILNFIKEHDNGITNFHFEITGELLDDDYFEIIKEMREGLIQFEIGIQSTSEPTMIAINRRMNQSKLFENIKRLLAIGNTHVHVDLIAGLPFDTFETFMDAFDQVYLLGAQQFQLGFLKVLSGTPIAAQLETYAFKIRDEAPYEILENKWLSFSELSLIKEIETLLEYYYNSEKFKMSLNYILKKLEVPPHEMFIQMVAYYKNNGFLDRAIATGTAYDYLYAFYNSKISDDPIIESLLKFDYYFAHLKGERSFFEKPHIPEFNQLRLKYLSTEDAVQKLGDCYRLKSAKEILKTVTLVVFEYDIMALLSSNFEEIRKERTVILFDYHVESHALAPCRIIDVSELLESGETFETHTHSS